MNCNDIQKFAFTYLDCEFDARERGEFETHVRLCQPCRAAVERDAMFRGMIRNHLERPAADPACRARVRDAMTRAQRRQTSRAVVMPLALAASAAIVVVVWRVAPQQQADQPVHAQPVVAAAKPAAPVSVAGLGGAQRLPVLHRAEVAAVVPARELPPRLMRQPTGNAAIQLTSATTMLPPGSAMEQLGEVLHGGLSPNSLSQHSPFGAVRSDESLRAMARVHAANLPPEVNGPATRVQKYLAARVPNIGPLPVSEGAGVTLQGARIAMIGAQAVVIYSYSAYGVPLTVVSRAKAGRAADDPEFEETSPGAGAPTGVLLDRRAGLYLLHVVSHDRVLTLVSELGAPALMQLAPSANWL